MTTTREEFEAWAKDRGHYLKRRADGVYMDSSACKAWDAWQAAHLAGQRAMRERVGTLCDELEQHWSDYKDTAIINGNVALSNAASGEPRAAREIKAAALALEVKP